VLRAAYGDYSELCVLDMGEQIRIIDLARHMITMSGLVPDVDIPIVYTGLRPGEKLYEELLAEEEERTQQVSDKIFVAQSPAPPEDLEERLRGIIAAAQTEEAAGVVALLMALIPSYQPMSITHAVPEPAHPIVSARWQRMLVGPRWVREALQNGLWLHRRRCCGAELPGRLLFSAP